MAYPILRSDGDAVFFAELDDDYQEITDLTPGELHARLTCYYLIAPKIVIHPAYVWQSSITHSLLGQAGKELLRPPFTELELGAYDNIETYMQQRLDQLQRPHVTTKELRSYVEHGDDLFDEARDLSVRFNTASRRKVTSYRRDRLFRDLLYRDLDTASFETASLAQLLTSFTTNFRGVMSETPLGESLKDFVVSGGELVSVDTFLKEIYDEGFTELAADPHVKKRLLALYYETYCDRGTMIPATRKLQPGTLVNPYDAEVFWQAMSGIFGQRFSTLSQADDDASLRALRDIRETSDWETFRGIYFDTLETVDRTVRSQPEAVVTRLKSLHPGSSRQYVLRQLWESRKLVIAGAAFSALGAPGFALATPTGVGLTTAGVLGLGASGLSLAKEVRSAVQAYQAQDIVKVRDTIEHFVSHTIRDIGGVDR